jgi:ATP-binding cassette subfamily B protein/subfamily B ATP-binding cassette protein MsbA
MKNFARALRVSMRHRWTLLGAFLSSLVVGLLWGANLGTIYPVTEVVFRGKSLRDWVELEIASSRATIREARAAIASIDAQLPQSGPEQRKRLERRRLQEETRLEAEVKAERRALRIQPWIVRWTPDDPFQTLLVLVAVVMVLTVVKDSVLVANTLLVERVTQRTTYDLRTQVYRRSLDLDMCVFQQDGASGLMSRLTHDMHALSAGVRQLWGKCVREPLKMLACLIGAAYICWRLLILTLILAPLAAYFIRRLAGSLRRANRRAMEEMQELFGVLAESFGGVQVVKAYTMERYERRRVRETSKRLYAKAMRIAVYTALVKPATEIMGISVICLAMVAGGYLVLSGETELLGITMCDRPLGIGALAAFYALVVGVSDPARKLSDVMGYLQQAAAAADRIFPLLDARPQIVDPPQPRRLLTPHRELAFEGVSFHYLPGEPVLREIDLRIPFGEKLAIVGSNGCGKSTLVNLVTRFYDPVEGSVRLDDVDLRACRVRELRRKIGIVTQQTVLFDDTVMSNIRYGSLHATDEQVIEAAKKAHAHRFIVEKLDDGYQTIVGERGGRLSGGQRQRIALARAILRDPEILILDEATSQIDLESEQLIHQALRDFIRGRTAILITHRLSTLTLADRILVMDAGRIADLGTHQQLLARCDLYRRLHQIQFRESA